jgi:uncharacterized protein (TIGR02646 family)
VKHLLHPLQVPNRLGKTKAASWNGFKSPGKKEITNSLLPAQKHLCVYCQIRLDSDIGHHVEHIINKSLNRSMTFTWTNLALSCTNSDRITNVSMGGGLSCGHSSGKQSWNLIDPRFILPTEPDCEKYFEYRASDGSVQPAPGLTPNEMTRATYTRDLLNLNCSRLRRLRKDMLETGFEIIREFLSDPEPLRHFLECELNETNLKLQAFHTARVQQFGVFL